ncbi:hypothetical protein RB653_007909 [Dictyostelium firmibasis]|uniref:Uncharacterized protein n=1 Tax=Dictyostelium firmibasis TaxID=79012 RepID=A0AAN7U1Y1_9MYCE
MNKKIIFFLIFINFTFIKSIVGQNPVWVGGSGCTLFTDSSCWSPSVTPLTTDIITMGVDNSQTVVNGDITLTTLPNNNLTLGGVQMSSTISMEILDTTLIVSGAFSLANNARLSLSLSDAYANSLVSGSSTRGAINVLMNLPSMQTLTVAQTFTMNGNSVLDVNRSISTINGVFTMNNDSSLFMYSKQNGDSKFTAGSTVLNDRATLNFQGQSFIYFNQSNLAIGVTLNDNSKIIGLNADNIKLSGILTLNDQSNIQLTSSRLYLDSLVTSPTSSIISINSTLSILQSNPTIFSAGSAVFKGSVLTIKSNCTIQSQITMMDSVYSFNQTHTFANQFTGSNVYMIMDSATLNAANYYDCSGCSLAMRNSIANFNSYSNQGDLIMSSSKLNSNTGPIVSNTGSIYGYYGELNQALTVESGSLGVYNEKTRIFVNGNVIVESGAKIQFYLSSPLDFSWLNTSGSLDVQSGTIVEIYVYIEILNNGTMEVIKTSNGFITPLTADNVKLYTYDPDNDIITDFSTTGGCEYSLSFTNTSVFVHTDYSCQQAVITLGGDGLSKGSLAGISVSMVALAGFVSLGVWWKTGKSNKQRNDSHPLESFSQSKSSDDTDVERKL